MARPNPEPDFSRPTVLYDGFCGICEKTVTIAKGLDREGTLSFVAYQDVATDTLHRAGLSPEKCATHMRVITAEEEIFTGAFAVNFIAYRLGPLRLLVILLYLVPPLLLLEVILYEMVSRNRQEISQKLGLAACKVPTRSL